MHKESLCEVASILDFATWEKQFYKESLWEGNDIRFSDVERLLHKGGWGGGAII